MAHIKNWRDQQPEVAHLSAIRWPGLRQRNATPKHDEDDSPQLHNLQGVVKHGLQGRKTSDHHKHPQVEQAYYILSGSGEVLVGDDRFPVRPGDAVYLPADIYHQMFNDMNDEWLEHLVLSKNIDTEPRGECVIRNWEDVLPVSDGAGAIRWHQLGPVGEENTGCLKSIAFIDREAVQPGQQSIARCYDDIELGFWILENQGILVIPDGEQHITEGDAVHLPPGTSYHIENPHSEWLSYMIIAG